VIVKTEKGVTSLKKVKSGLNYGTRGLNQLMVQVRSKIHEEEGKQANDQDEVKTDEIGPCQEETLSNVNMDIKRAVHSLCVITDSENYHKWLTDDSNTFDVIAEVPLLCKLELKRRFSPINIFFKYHGNDENDLTTHISLKHKVPSLARHQKRNEKPRVVTVHTDFNQIDGNNNLIFREEFIYFSLESLTGINVTISTKYGKLGPSKAFINTFYES